MQKCFGVKLLCSNGNPSKLQDRRKADRKLDKVEEKGRKQKEFLLELSDKKMIRKRADQVAYVIYYSMGRQC